MAAFRAACRVARTAGFTLIEWLTVMVIVGLMALSAGQLIGASMDRTDRVVYQTLLMDRVDAMWSEYLHTGTFPDQVTDDARVQFTVSACGPLCRTIELRPLSPHPCEYWRLSTDGTRGAGGLLCW